MTEPLELPFDVYQRYRLVTDVLCRLRAAAARRDHEPERRLRVLDVGGRTAVLRAFDPEDRIDLVDLEALEGTAGLVVGDGARLPFADRSFDVVCAFDTLEHVPPPAREAFVDECARVALSWVVLAGPYDAPQVVEAEETLQRFLREKLCFEHRYLNEHRHHGLPDRAAVEARLASKGARVRSVGHANLDRWLAFLAASLYLDLEPGLRDLAKAFYRFYNRELYASDHAEPVYRHAVIAALDGAPLPDLEGLLDPPVAPAGALAPFAELERELLAFDRQRSAWRREEELLRETIGELEGELAAHAASLAEAQDVIAGKDADIAALKADFASERAGLEGLAQDLRNELEARDGRILVLGGERDRAEGEADAHRHRAEAEAARAGELERNLAFERDQVAARDAELARLALEVRAREAHAERELADRDREIARLAEEVRAREAFAEREIADRDAELARLADEVRSKEAYAEREIADRDREVERLAGEVRAKEAFAEREIADRDRELARVGELLREAEAEREAQRHALLHRDERLADLERVLGEHRAVLAAREAQVAEQTAHVGNLEAHLADRNRELKRLPMAALRRVMWLVFGRPPTV